MNVILKKKESILVHSFSESEKSFSEPENFFDFSGPENFFWHTHFLGSFAS